MNLKAIFDEADGGVLTHEQFVAACKEAGIKLADLSTGDYVSKKKFDDELTAKDTQIAELNETISKRDNDLAGLKTQLETAGGDIEKLNKVTSDLTALQGKYDEDVKNYQAKLQKQAYEFAVKEFANSKDFSSKAAKRDFINSMIAKDLKMEDGKIMGADDFIKSYSAENEDAFITEYEEESNESEGLPKFVDSTSSKDYGEDKGFSFNFTGVREH